jgi:ATP-dependent Clp protease ATP-binding subunit ClpB
MPSDDRFGRNLFQEFGLDEAKLKDAIQDIRGTKK